MKILTLPLVLLCFAFSLNAQKTTIGTVERLKPEMDNFVAPNAKIELLADGFLWSEGPIWVDRLDALLFSDVPQNKIFRWDEKNGLSVFLDPSGYTGIAPGEKNGRKEPGSNGLTLDKQGRLIICMHGDRRVARLTDWEKTGFETIIGKYNGKHFNSPNDLVYAKNGDLYFTDPPYGLQKGDQDEFKELPFNGVYRLSVSGKLSLIVDNLTRPNGIAISNDQKTLYVAISDPKNPRVMAYDLVLEGAKNARIFFDGNLLAQNNKGSFDGLKVHPSGTIFATGPGGVLVISPQGTHLGTIRTGERIANCGFDSSYQYLYMTSHMYLTRIKL